MVSRIVYSGALFGVRRLAPTCQSDGAIRIAQRSKPVPLKSMIFRGPYPDVTIPEVSLTDFIFSSTKHSKTSRRLIDGPSGRVLTYGEFEDAVRRVAASLAQRGFKKGDVLRHLQR